MKTSTFIAGIIWLVSILWVLSVSRNDFYYLWSTYTIAFASYAWIVFSNYRISLWAGLMLALGARLLTFFFDPQLSDDFYRFIWDGMVMHDGMNPVAFTPAELMRVATERYSAGLYALLNSQQYYSVYPPVSQMIFFMSFGISVLDIESNIMFFRSILLLADFIVIFLLGKLLLQNRRPLSGILIYALNPLIIIEYTGNLHMEALMISSLFAALFFAEKKNWIISSFMMTISVSAKLLSLILMPFMPRHLLWKRFIAWSVLTLLQITFIFWLFFRSHAGWLESVRLWFQSFEFNAGIYYFVQALYSSWKGYEEIKIIGPVMGICTILLIGLVWLFYLRKKEMHWSVAMTLVLTFYFLLTTTLHPWYLGTLLAVSVISGYRYPVIWTYLVFLSYSHYANGEFRENFLFIILEYTLLILLILYEFYQDGFKIKKPLPVDKSF